MAAESATTMSAAALCSAVAAHEAASTGVANGGDDGDLDDAVRDLDAVRKLAKEGHAQLMRQRTINFDPTAAAAPCTPECRAPPSEPSESDDADDGCRAPPSEPSESAGSTDRPQA